MISIYTLGTWIFLISWFWISVNSLLSQFKLKAKFLGFWSAVRFPHFTEYRTNIKLICRLRKDQESRLNTDLDIHLCHCNIKWTIRVISSDTKFTTMPFIHRVSLEVATIKFIKFHFFGGHSYKCFELGFVIFSVLNYILSIMCELSDPNPSSIIGF